MAIRIEDGVEVGAPAAAVFAFVARVEDYPAWLPGVLRAEPVEGGGFRLASTGPGGLEIASVGRVQAADPPRSISISATSPYFALEASCAIEELAAERSRITVRAVLQPRGLAIFAAGQIAGELRAAVPDTLRRLRQALEAGRPG